MNRKSRGLGSVLLLRKEIRLSAKRDRYTTLIAAAEYDHVRIAVEIHGR